MPHNCGTLCWYLLSLGGTEPLLPALAFEGLLIVYHVMTYFLFESPNLEHFCDWVC